MSKTISWWNHQLWATFPLMARKRTTANQMQISKWSRKTLTENIELSPKTVLILHSREIIRCFQIVSKIPLVEMLVVVVFRWGLNHNRHYLLKSVDPKFFDTGKRRNREWIRIMFAITAEKIWRRIDSDIMEDSYLRSRCPRSWKMRVESMRYTIPRSNVLQKQSKSLRLKNIREALPAAATNARRIKDLESWRHNR